MKNINVKFALKIVFFCKMIVDCKNEKGVIKNLKIKKLKNVNSRIYLGICLELLRAVWGHFSFR